MALSLNLCPWELSANGGRGRSIFLPALRGLKRPIPSLGVALGWGRQQRDPSKAGCAPPRRTRARSLPGSPASHRPLLGTLLARSLASCRATRHGPARVSRTHPGSGAIEITSFLFQPWRVFRLLGGKTKQPPPPQKKEMRVAALAASWLGFF